VSSLSAFWDGVRYPNPVSLASSGSGRDTGGTIILMMACSRAWQSGEGSQPDYYEYEYTFVFVNYNSTTNCTGPVLHNTAVGFHPHDQAGHGSATHLSR
jgi:hypothetical protein